MSRFADLVADRRSALMQMNQEVRCLRELLEAAWDDPDYRAKRPVLWDRTQAYLKRTERHETGI